MEEEKLLWLIFKLPRTKPYKTFFSLSMMLQANGLE